MTRRRAGLVATGLVAVAVLAGCSGADDDRSPAPTVSPTSGSTSGSGATPPQSESGATPPPIAPSGSVAPPTTGLPETLSPSPTGTALPIPIPSQPAN